MKVNSYRLTHYVLTALAINVEMKGRSTKIFMPNFNFFWDKKQFFRIAKNISQNLV